MTERIKRYHLGKDAVIDEHIQDSAVKESKINDTAVTETKIADEAVAPAKLKGWTHGSISVDLPSVGPGATATKEVPISGISKGDPAVAQFFDDPGASVAIIGAYGSRSGSLTLIVLNTSENVTNDVGAITVNFFAMTE